MDIIKKVVPQAKFKDQFPGRDRNVFWASSVLQAATLRLAEPSTSHLVKHPHSNPSDGALAQYYWEGSEDKEVADKLIIFKRIGAYTKRNVPFDYS